MAEIKKEWKKLNEFQHSRIRNEIMFGSREPHTQVVLEYKDGRPLAVETSWIPAVFTAFREVLDNALDEVVTHKHGDRIDVFYAPDTMIFSIEDNGRGIPIDFDEEEQEYAATVLMGDLRAGRNFEERGNSRGMNGLGGSVVNICSEWFELDIHRDGKRFVQRFHEGDLTNHVRETPKITPAKGKKTGTKVSFKLSAHVFPLMTLPESFIKARMLEIALCYPNLKIFYNGDRVTTKGSIEKSVFADLKPISFTVEEGSFKSVFWLAPEFSSSGAELTHALVNAIPNFNGGVHIDAFKSQFFSGLIEALSATSKRRRLTPNRSDVADGLLLYNITEMDAPTFDSQNKVRLLNKETAAIVKKALDDPDFFKRVIRTNPDWIESIYKRCAERTQKKDDADTAREAKKNLRVKVEDLDDACGTDRQKCILFLGEGKSAISGIVEARSPDIHGGLPLRGKVLNVHGQTNKQVLANEALAKIMSSLGLAPGTGKVNRQNLRYGQVNIATDADEDGKNIAALIVNFFYTLWPDLFYTEHATEKEDCPMTGATRPKRIAVENPFIYVFETPLIIAVKGKVRKYWYADNVDSFNNEDYKGWEITRAKGLAALKKADWKHALAEPRLRPMVGDLDACLKLLFDPKMADSRKDWIGL